MKRFGIVGFFAILLAVMLVTTATSHAQESLTVPVKIAPHTVNLDAKGHWITVVAEIPYDTVDGSSVMLEGIAASSTQANCCGDLVAKFAIDDVKEILTVGEVTLTLTGSTIEGGLFSGSDTIKVIKPANKP